MLCSKGRTSAVVISVIVPIYNEEKILRQNSAFFRELSRRTELIFVDGQSLDQSARIAGNCARVVESAKGRARQMNCGAQTANHQVLFFLPADAVVAFEVLGSIEKIVKNNGFIGGCLTQQIDKRGALFRLIEGIGNTRARISKVFYGDQGIFVRKDIFRKINGFPQVPIMEDVLFSKKLRRQGRTVVLDGAIWVSARRWESEGVFKTTLRYSFLNILFWLSLPLEKIKAFYDELR